MMENTVKKLEEQVKGTDQTLDSIAAKVGNVQKEFCQEGTKIEVNRLLQSVHDVKNDYQNLRKEISEVQDLQKQLSTSLQVQRRLMQTKFLLLKQRLLMNVPQKHLGVPPHNNSTNNAIIVTTLHHNASDNSNSALSPKMIHNGD